MQARVVRISVTPVKALGLLHPEHVNLTPDGITGDRRFWIVDEDGRLFNNKRCGPLATIRPEWDEGTRALALTFPDGERVEATVELGESVDVALYGVPHPSRRVLGPWEEALAAFASEPVRLLWSEQHATDRGRNGGSVSLVSRGSLERLAREAGVAAPVDGRRFRMTFELDGAAEHEEDTWIGQTVSVGAAQIVVEGDVGRCLVTSHDPDTGITDLDTLGTLARYRPEGVVERLPFGVYARVSEPGRVRLGDAVRAATPV
jgi:uncharacterized protein YcbX